MACQQKWSFLSQEEKVHRCCSANKKCFLHVFTLLYLSNYFVECFQGVTHILSADISPCLWGFLQHLSQFQSASGARNHIFVTQIPLYLTVFIYIYTIYIYTLYIYIYTVYIYILLGTPRLLVKLSPYSCWLKIQVFHVMHFCWHLSPSDFCWCTNPSYRYIHHKNHG